MATTVSIRLEFSDGKAPLTSLAEINQELKTIGSVVFALDLSAAPANIRQLLARPTVSDAELEQIKSHFLLPRERLLEIIAAAGAAPPVAGGGEMSTFDATHSYYYPQLWVVQNDIDYSRFDRFHINTADDGTAVCEIGQLLAGRGLVLRHRLDDGAESIVRLDCQPDQGWIVAYGGGKPHIGSVASASPGTKVLVQVIGPPRWQMRYVE